MLSMLVRFGETWHAWRVFAKMPERDVFSWNVMVGGYGKAGLLEEALDLYHRMMWAGVRPDVYTFPCVLRSCGGVPDWRMGREVHAHVLRFGFGEEVDVLNALMNMYVKCGYVVAAGKVFDSMAVMDFISWNAAGHFFLRMVTAIQGWSCFYLRKLWDGSGGNVWLLVSLAFSVLILILSLIQRWKCAFRNPYSIPISIVYFVALFFLF